MTFSQPQLIESILSDLNLDAKSNSRSIPALTTKILQPCLDSQHHCEDWHYRSVIGKMNYLEKATRPDIAYAVHQCARFSESPREEHSQAVKLIGRYLLGTRNKGMIFKPVQKSFEVFSDDDFSRNWDINIAENDQSTARSRTGYAIKYANCTIACASKLQTEIALSSTKSEYIALSQSLREVIPLMRLVNELNANGFAVPGETPRVLCKAFEDNSGALEMARTPKMRPRTKHLNIKYHHFRDAVLRGDISILPINTLDQIADVFTKPLGLQLFIKFRKLLMGW
jgi:hypothetical protein